MMPNFTKCLTDTNIEPLETQDKVTRTKAKNVLLIPQPSNNKEDPLNWSPGRKARQLGAIIFAGFAATISPWSNSLAVVIQAGTYRVTPVHMSYASSASSAGLMIGPVLLHPFVPYLGRSTATFWSLILLMVTQIWAASTTGHNGYYSFIISRIFSGVFCSLPTVLGCSFILETFFLHQRGRILALYDMVFLLGPTCALTFGGFILEDRRLGWPWTIWWTVPVAGLASVLVFLFCEDTTYDRTCIAHYHTESNWLRKRLMTVLMGWYRRTDSSKTSLGSRFLKPLAIAVSPISFIPGLYSMITFGFGLLVAVFTSIYLQTPESTGGYGFTPRQNAYFTFVTWTAIILAQLSSLLFGDRLPLWIARRFGDRTWRPEYRLFNMLFPITAAPIGLALVGICLQYHLHYMVLAAGTLLIFFGSTTTVPFCITYIVECYTENPVDVAIAFGIWRLSLGIGLPFFITSWQKAVGIGWQFGSAALLVFGAGLMTLGAAVWGHHIRQSKLMQNRLWKISSEEGQRVIKPTDEVA